MTCYLHLETSRLALADIERNGQKLKSKKIKRAQGLKLEYLGTHRFKVTNRLKQINAVQKKYDTSSVHSF